MGFKERNNKKFFHLANGNFDYWDGESKRAIREIDGIIESIEFGQTEFKGRMQNKLFIDMRDGEEQYRIDMAYPSVGATMFGAILNSISAGQHIELIAFGNKDNPKISCVVGKVLNTQDGAWDKCAREDWSDMSWPEKQDAADTVIRNHPLFIGERPIPESAKPASSPASDEYDPFKEE